jgi:hypothetical protein
LGDLDAESLELAHQIFNLDLGEVMLHYEHSYFRRLDNAALFGGVHESADALATLENCLQLVLRQLTLDVLSSLLA